MKSWPNWIQNKMRVLITRPVEQTADFAAALRAIGAQPVFLPAITIRPVEDTSALDHSLARLDHYSWLILTSANAAEIILERMNSLRIGAPPQSLRLAAIGPKTAAKLEAGGLHPDFIPDQYIAEAILPGLGDLMDRWVLLPLADIADDTLPNAIEAAGGIAHVIEAYHTLPAEPEPEGLAALRLGVDLLTFTSGSTVRNFFALVQSAGLDPLNLPGSPKVACIGPKTAQTARDLGFTVDLIADPYTSDGLVAAIQSHFIQL
ncbi:MAG TPA: hypothetical protein DEH25_01970 [Chloroflexi bacterium]|nr:hypothetical protein [Chloroflexota bacterium]